MTLNLTELRDEATGKAPHSRHAVLPDESVLRRRRDWRRGAGPESSFTVRRAV